VRAIKIRDHLRVDEPVERGGEECVLASTVMPTKAGKELVSGDVKCVRELANAEVQLRREVAGEEDQDVAVLHRGATDRGILCVNMKPERFAAADASEGGLAIGGAQREEGPLAERGDLAQAVRAQNCFCGLLVRGVSDVVLRRTGLARHCGDT
jgi:hypothetical protein